MRIFYIVNSRHDFRLVIFIGYNGLDTVGGQAFLKQAAADGSGGTHQSDGFNLRMFAGKDFAYDIKDRQDGKLDLLLDFIQKEMGRYAGDNDKISTGALQGTAPGHQDGH